MKLLARIIKNNNLKYYNLFTIKIFYKNIKFLNFHIHKNYSDKNT